MDSPCSSTTSCSSPIRAWPSRPYVRSAVGAAERPLRGLPQPAFAHPHLAEYLASLDAGLCVCDVLQASVALRQEQQLSVSCCGPAPLPWSAGAPQSAAKRHLTTSCPRLEGCDSPTGSSCSAHSNCDRFAAPVRNVRQCLPQLVIG